MDMCNYRVALSIEIKDFPSIYLELHHAIKSIHLFSGFLEEYEINSCDISNCKD